MDQARAAIQAVAQAKPTPFAIYCLARAWRLYGERFDLARCGTDPRLCFAALIGMEDAERFQANVMFCIPTEAAFHQVLDRVLASQAPRIADVVAPAVKTTNGARAVPTSSALDDIARATSDQIRRDG